MKKTLIFLLFISLGLQAQERNFEKIKAHKTAYITEKVALTSSQAEQFWPIYNKFEEEVMTLRKSERDDFNSKKDRNIDDLTDSEANAMLAKHGQIRAELATKLQGLINSLKGIITPQQTIKLLRAEEDFKKRLLRRYRDRKGRDGKGPDRGRNNRK